MSRPVNPLHTLSLAALLMIGSSAMAAPQLSLISGPLVVGGTVQFKVSDTSLTDALDSGSGVFVLDFNLHYDTGLFEYQSASSLVTQAFLTAPDVSVGDNPAGDAALNWILLEADAPTPPTDLFTVSFKVLGLPTTTPSALTLSLPTGGVYGSSGSSYTSSSVTVTAVPEPLSSALALAGLGTLGWCLRRRGSSATLSR